MEKSDRAKQRAEYQKLNHLDRYGESEYGIIRLAICRNDITRKLEFRMWWPGKEFYDAEIFPVIDVLEIEQPTNHTAVWELAKGLAEFEEFITSNAVNEVINQISHAVWDRARIPETENLESNEQKDTDNLRIAICKNPDKEGGLSFIPLWPGSDFGDYKDLIDVIDVEHAPFIEQSRAMVLALKAIADPHISGNSVKDFIDAVSTAVWNLSKQFDIETKIERE
ncbi:hypothetical protein ACFL3T_01890 [Patescibacteria group bacterium]